MSYNKIIDIPFVAYLFWLAVGGGLFLYYAIKTTIMLFPPANPTYFYLITLIYSIIISFLFATLSVLLHINKISSKKLLIILFVSTFICTIFFSVGSILHSNWIFSKNDKRNENFIVTSKHFSSYASGGKLITSPWRFILSNKDNKIEIGVDARLYQLSEKNDTMTVSIITGFLFGEYVIDYEKTK